MLELKETMYPTNGEDVRVAYLIIGNTVYFSGLERKGSTVNFAEKVILAVCQVENLDWRECIFYDFQTNRGYHHDSKPGYYYIDRLHVRRSDDDPYLPYVHNWEVIDGSFKEVKDTGIPEDVFNTFKRLIY